MITAEELTRLLADGDSDLVERTAATEKTDKFAQAVTAFSNDFPGHKRPGYLIVGANDDGSLSGLKVTDRLLQNLGALRSDGNILPLPAMSVARFSLPDGEVAVAEVIPADLPPVRYKGQVWIRVGPRKAIATEQEERVLADRRVARARTFDAMPCLETSLDDMSLAAFRETYLPKAVDPEVIAANHRTVREQLASLRFFDSSKNCPTNAGILLFGKDPLACFPGAYVQYLRVRGAALDGEVLVEKRLSGDLLTVLRRVDDLISLAIRQWPVPVSAAREEARYDIPESALREFVMNALMHRTYESNAPVRFYWFDDRVEIQSPGGLFGLSSPENFPEQNDYRNPVVAEAMKSLGYVNRFGGGVRRAQAALARNRNRPAEFQLTPHFVKVTVWTVS